MWKKGKKLFIIFSDSSRKWILFPEIFGTDILRVKFNIFLKVKYDNYLVTPSDLRSTDNIKQNPAVAYR